MKLSLGGLNKYRMEYNKVKKSYWHIISYMT
jgi:hypothetical protein